MVDTLRTWMLSYRCKPWLLNDERAGGNRGVGGHHGRARLTKEWRDAFAGLCLENRVPPLEWAHIEVLQLCRDGRRPDIGNCYPSVKAAVDGLVDACVIPDDKGEWVHSLNFAPPATVGYDALVLRVSGPVASKELRTQREVELQAKMLRKLRRSAKRAVA